MCWETCLSALANENPRGGIHELAPPLAAVGPNPLPCRHQRSSATGNHSIPILAPRAATEQGKNAALVIHKGIGRSDAIG